jgi:hypothetical protein
MIQQGETSALYLVIIIGMHIPDHDEMSNMYSLGDNKHGHVRNTLQDPF